MVISYGETHHYMYKNLSIAKCIIKLSCMYLYTRLSHKNIIDPNPVIIIFWPITLSLVLTGPTCIGPFITHFLGLLCSRYSARHFWVIYEITDCILAIPLFIGVHLIPVRCFSLNPVHTFNFVLMPAKCSTICSWKFLLLGFCCKF